MGFEDYGGASIFGLAVSMRGRDLEPAAQEDSFFGVDGVTSVYGGGRGTVRDVSGALVADDILGLNGLEASFRSFRDGIARPLTDTRGRVWPDMRLKWFRPTSGPRPTDTGGCVPYAARFRGLSSP